MLNHFEKYLIDHDYGFSGSVKDASKYAILNAGKRIRPHLLLALLSDYGVDFKLGLSSALAVEMIHNYSLIHDDLPAMDNDDFRRGRPSTHKAFGEDIAILAGDALLTESFGVISNDESIDAVTKVELIKNLSKFSGSRGMIYGQQQDLAGEGMALDLDAVNEINIYKTSNLIMFSLTAAAIISNKPNDIKILEKLGADLGLAFQIQDDIFDVTKSFEELGKMPSDEDNDKSTYVKLIGLKNSEKKLSELFDNCFNILDSLDLVSDNLYNLVKDILNRNN